MTTFDPTKPVQTRDGRKARIICTDAKAGIYSIIALITEAHDYGDDLGEEFINYYTAEGTISPTVETRSDLVNVPEVKWIILLKSKKSSTWEVLYRIYENKDMAIHRTTREGGANPIVFDYKVCELKELST